MRGRGPGWECAWSVQGTAWDAVRLGRGWEMGPARELLPDPRGTRGRDSGFRWKDVGGCREGSGSTQAWLLFLYEA